MRCTTATRVRNKELLFDPANGVRHFDQHLACPVASNTIKPNEALLITQMQARPLNKRSRSLLRRRRRGWSTLASRGFRWRARDWSLEVKEQSSKQYCECHDPEKSEDDPVKAL